MNEVLKAFGKDVLEKIRKNFDDVKPKIQFPKKFVEMDIKLCDKVQFKFQIKKLDKKEDEKCQTH